MQLAKYPSVSWRVLRITIMWKFRGGGGGIFIKYSSTLSNISLKLHELLPHYHLYPVCEEGGWGGGGGGGGGIHNIKYVGWKGWFVCPFTLKTTC